MTPWARKYQECGPKMCSYPGLLTYEHIVQCRLNTSHHITLPPPPPPSMLRFPVAAPNGALLNYVCGGFAALILQYS